MTKQLSLALVLICSLLTLPKAQASSVHLDPQRIDAKESADSLNSEHLFLLDAILVQGFKQEKAYKLSPISATTLNHKLLERENLKTIKEITGFVPNLYIPDYGAKVSSPVYIRGVGSKINSPSVGLYVDGIPYFESSSFDFNLADIEKIDVLRGPQGTLYGRNTMGGIIEVYSKSPLHHQGTRFTFTGANYNQYHLTAAHSFKIKEGMGLSLSANYNHLGGFFKNETLQTKADEQDAGLGRVRFDWEISPKWKLRLISSLDFLDQGGFPYGVYNLTTGKVASVNYNQPSTYQRTLSSSGANLEFLGRGFRVHSQTSFQYLSDQQKIDQDFSPRELFYVTKKDKHHMIAEELTIKSDTPCRYQWIFGLFGFYQTIDRELQVDKFSQEVKDKKFFEIPTYGFATFHQSTLNHLFWRGLSLTAGVRFDYEYAKNDFIHYQTKTENNSLVSQLKDKLSFKQFTPKLTLQYTTPTHQNIYSTVSKGYKSGGFNVSFDEQEERTFEPEYSWNYEIGAKLNFFNNRLTTDLALFYIDWRDQQVYQPLASGTGRKLANIGRSSSKGVELSVIGLLTESLTLQANYGYTQAIYKNYLFNEATNYKNHHLPLVPNQTLSLHGNYSFYHPIAFIDKVQLGVTYLGTGKIYWADNNNQAQGFYGIWNTQLAITKGDVTLTLWGRNITNKDYIAYSVQTNQLLAQKGKPLTFGGTIHLQF